MIPFRPQTHRRLLETIEGLEKCVQLGLSESEHLDFKVARDRRAPTFKAKLRITAGALASSGEGYLVIGMDESRDQRAMATAVVGIPFADAGPLAQQADSVLAAGLDPPLLAHRARIVRLRDPSLAVVVVYVKGRKKYPVSVQVDDDDGVKFYVRGPVGNNPLTPHDARLRRRELDSKRLLIPFAAAFLLLLLGLVGVKVSSLAPKRRLSDDQRSAFLHALEGKTVGIVEIETTIGDTEAFAYASSVAEVFHDAGWAVETSQAIMTGPGTQGLFLIGGDPGPDSVGCHVPFDSPLYAAALGFEASEVEAALVCDPKLGTYRPKIHVGRNPDSAEAKAARGDRPFVDNHIRLHGPNGEPLTAAPSLH